LRDVSGKQFDLTLHGMSMSDLDRVHWVRPFRQRPLYLQNGQAGLWCEFIAQSSTLYCSFRNYEDLQANADRMLAAIREHHPKKVAIDMRFNLGGDYTLGEQYVIAPLKALPGLNSYQEARELRLPNSHLVVRVSTKFYRFSDAPQNELRPDHNVVTTWLDYKNGRDPLLEWVENVEGQK
jgi:hypothetical protein